MRRVSLLALVCLYVLAGVIAFHTFVRPKQEEPVAGFVVVEVDGREVYRRELNSFTAYGALTFLYYALDAPIPTTDCYCCGWNNAPLHLIGHYSPDTGVIMASSMQDYYVAQFWYLPHCLHAEPLKMVFVDFVEPMDTPFPPQIPWSWSYQTNYVSVSHATVSYAYNSTHFVFSIAAHAAPDSDITLDYILLLGPYGRWIGGTLFSHTIILYEKLGVAVPGGSSCTVHIIFAWRDYNGFKENWGRLLSLVFDPSQQVTLTDVDGNTFTAAAPALNQSLAFCETPEGNRLRMVFGSGTTPPTRTEHRMANPVARVTVHIAHPLAVTAVAPVDATEVGLEVMVRDRWVLVFRQVFSQPVKAGTPVTIYIAPPSAAP